MPHKDPAANKAYHQNYELKYRDRRRDKTLQKRYGINSQQYDEMFNQQLGCCAICGRHQSVLKQRLHIDHCHRSGKVRKLLCQQCNQCLGFVGDNPEILSNMIKYLSEHQ
jgi:hypothetical protein